MKTLKRLLSVCLAVAMSVSFCGVLSACKPVNNNEQNTSSEADDLVGFKGGTLISENWKLARVPDIQGIKGEEMSTQQYQAGDEWITATVPGTVLTSYEYAGLIDDPYYGNNMAELSQDYYNVDYWYRTEFSVPDSYDGRRVWLNFDGINHKADIYLNGNNVGRIEGAFIRGNFDITDFLNKDGVNNLAVYIHWCDSQVEDMPSFLCSASWDWMPAIPGRNMGIYKEVYLSCSDDVTVSDPYVVTDLPLPSVATAEVTASAFAKNNSDKTVTGTLKATVQRTDGSGKVYSLSKEVTLEGNEEKEIFFDTFVMDSPDLWWPNGSGEQPLYSITVVFEANGVVSDTVDSVFGVRELSYEYTEGDLTVIVNGRKILCKGGNWGIPDAMLQWTDEDFRDAIKMQADMNFNIVRTWHGTSDFDSFYKYCNEYGIMVYEDFWLNGWTRPRDIDMFMSNVHDKVRRLRNHPCIVIWCGENENIPPAPLNTKIPEAIRLYDNSRLYVDSSNSGPVAGGVTYAIQDPSWYFKHTVGFTTEIGTPCIPTADSMRMMMAESDLWPIGNEVWDLHDWNFGIGNKLVETYEKAINSRYGKADNIDSFCEKAQLLNYETYKAMFEAWNDGLFTETSGILLWMSNPAWPSTIWQLYDYYKDATGGYYGSKVACEPVHIQWSVLTGKIKAINTTAEDIENARAEIKVYNLDSSVKYDKTFTLDALALGATEITEILATDGGKDLSEGKVYSASSAGDGNYEYFAFDGRSDTRWAAGGTGAQWLCVDLSKTENIDHVRLEWENAFASGYRVETSLDGSVWKQVAKVTGGDGGIDLLAFDSTPARYVRVFCTNAGTMWAYSLYEMDVIEAGSMGEGIEGLSDTHFIKLKLFDSDNNLLSENFYWNGLNSCDYTSMEGMKKATVNAVMTKTEKDSITYLTVELENKSDVCAVGMSLKIQKSFIYSENEDKRVLPAEYSDNFFSLTPGESKTVTVAFETSKLNGADPVLILDGYNSATQAIYLPQ